MLAKDLEKEHKFIISDMVSEDIATMYCRTNDVKVLIYNGERMTDGIMAMEATSQKTVVFPSKTAVTLVV